MDKLAIIGGSGFIGSRLILKLEADNCVNLDKRPSPFYNEITKTLDIRQKESIQLPKGTKAVVLLAAEHRDDVTPASLYYDVNVVGTENVLDKMDEARVKHIVFTSSVAIYGLNKHNPSEDHPKDPFNHYGKSKWQAEQVIKKWFEKDPIGKSITIIRPTVVFGERNRGNVYNLLKQISSGKFLMIGKGQNKKSMAYVGNVVAFIKDRLEKNEKGYHVFNYTDKPDFNMAELVSVVKSKMNLSAPTTKIPYGLGMLGGYAFDVLAKLSGKKLPISSVRVKKFCANTQFDSSKAHTSYKVPFTLEQGLTKTLDHEFKNPKQDGVLFFSE
jgi:nucleoside-diphosphate-sugar epimerase